MIISRETNRIFKTIRKKNRRHSKQSTNHYRSTKVSLTSKHFPPCRNFAPQQLNKSIPGYRIHLFSQFPAHISPWDVHHIRGGLIRCGDSSEKLYKATPDYQQQCPAAVSTLEDITCCMDVTPTNSCPALTI